MILTNDLQTFLEQTSIPQVKTKPKTFLGIARQPHYENVISNIYAFYFDPHEEHQLGDLFVKSFLQCIQSKITPKNILEEFENFTDFLINTEYGTMEKGRIDILLHNNTHAIIIENKIYHQLVNNLDDYWDTMVREKKSVKNVIGVVLSLTSIHNINHNGFVNITHLEFLNEVMNNIGSRLMQANEKYLTFLKDLYQNIENMSTKHLSTEEFNFYIKNQNKILDTVKFNDQAKEHIKTQIVDAWNSIDGFEVKSATLNTYQFYTYRMIKKKDVDNIYFCVYFDELLSGKKEIWVGIYISSEYYKNYYHHDAINDIVNKFENYGIVKIDHEESNDWGYIAEKTYRNLTPEQIANLKDTIVGFIKEDKFVELFNALVEKLSGLSNNGK